MTIKHLVATALCLLPAHFALAQDNFINGVSISDADFGSADLFVTDVSVLDGQVCIGNGCVIGETFTNEELAKFSNTNHGLLFDDGSSATFPDRDWRLMVNESAAISVGGLERFSIEDVTAGTVPFTVLGGAPENALWIAASGQVGMGTSMPISNLDISGPGTVDLRLAPTDPTVRPFQLAVDDDGFFVRISTGALPFEISQFAASGSLQLLASGVKVNAGNFDDDFQVGSETEDAALFVEGSSGRVGFGTATPEEVLHIRTSANNTDAFALFDAAGAGSDAAFRLRQNGVIPTTWEFRNQQDSGRLNVGIAGGNTPLKIDNAANNNLIRLGRNGKPGEVNITGTLVVNNTTMNVPDYVFADDYALRPLAEVQAFIDENSHLPDVPSEDEIKANGVDMTAMQMILLKKVEELTLYTLEQEAIIAGLTGKAEQSDAQAALIASMQERLKVLEATR